MNHLQYEKSPYLLQHADNPVDWYPWGETALTRARQENRPIFLSIGYSTCHWCHVMAHESFTDRAVAEKLNRSFIAIKVDREERPDLDAGFMQACQMMNGQGGWPLNLFLCPDGKPFYALTYAPPQGRGGRPGLIDIIDKIADMWQARSQELVNAGESLANALLDLEAQSYRQPPEEAILHRAAEKLKELFDPQYGGFGSAPKFPQPHNQTLLFRLAQRFDDSQLAGMAQQTLDNIAGGGITDQLGGGMHRYSVDERWLIPHFEKMLYDQALISDAYLDAWLVSGQRNYRQAAEQVLNYCLRELQQDQGGFYCGEDADSEGREGTYYLWSRQDLEAELTVQERTLFENYYSISAGGNFEGKNILARNQTLAAVAEQRQLSTTAAEQLLQAAQSKLLQKRSRRPRPHLDDKIITAWNGLLIASLARAARLLDNDSYLHAAQKASAFISRELFFSGRLKRRYRAGDTRIDGFLEDYAYLIYGLIELFLSDFNSSHLERAMSLMQRCEELFNDGRGGYFDAAEPIVPGLGRGRSRQDGALPAASSVTAHNLFRLAQLTGNNAFEQRGKALLAQLLAKADQYPTAFAFLLQALDLSLSEPLTLVIVMPPELNSLPAPWKKAVHGFRPQLVTIVTTAPEQLSTLVPATAGKHLINNSITAWLCTGNSCLAPVTDPELLAEELKTYAPLKTFNR